MGEASDSIYGNKLCRVGGTTQHGDGSVDSLPTRCARAPLFTRWSKRDSARVTLSPASPTTIAATFRFVLADAPCNALGPGYPRSIANSLAGFAVQSVCVFFVIVQTVCLSTTRPSLITVLRVKFDLYFLGKIALDFPYDGLSLNRRGIKGHTAEECQQR
jgi:hypothetical protein